MLDFEHFVSIESVIPDLVQYPHRLPFDLLPQLIASHLLLALSPIGLVHFLVVPPRWGPLPAGSTWGGRTSESSAQMIQLLLIPMVLQQ